MKYSLAVLLVFFVLNEGFGQSINKYVLEGNELYKQEKFDQSLEAYRKSVQSATGDPVANYNLGNALFRNGKYNEAADAFNKTAEIGKGEDILQRAFYNKGVALSKQQKLEESIVAYKRAVMMDPADEDARVNLQKALMELKKKQPPQQQKKDDKKQDENKNDQKKQPPKSNLTKKQVEQLLKALQQREQQVQQKMMQQNRNRTAGQQEKDW